MTFRTTARHATGRALAIVLALVIAGGSIGWGHLGGDDPDCDLTLAFHGLAHSHLAAPSTESSRPDGHCYICHALRLLHMAVAAGRVRDLAQRSATVRSTDVPGTLLWLIGVISTPRAPPAVLL